MRTYLEFITVIHEMIGDFGSTKTYKKPKENCYGRKQYYTMLDKEVCAFKRKREE